VTAPAALPAPLTVRLTVDQTLDSGRHETNCDCGTEPTLTPMQVQYGLTGLRCARPGCAGPNPDRYGPAGDPWCRTCRGGTP
jgi:hypothetical protein